MCLFSLRPVLTASSEREGWRDDGLVQVGRVVGEDCLAVRTRREETKGEEKKGKRKKGS